MPTTLSEKAQVGEKPGVGGQGWESKGTPSQPPRNKTPLSARPGAAAAVRGGRKPRRRPPLVCCRVGVWSERRRRSGRRELEAGRVRQRRRRRQRGVTGRVGAPAGVSAPARSSGSRILAASLRGLRGPRRTRPSPGRSAKRSRLPAAGRARSQRAHTGARAHTHTHTHTRVRSSAPELLLLLLSAP